MCLGDRCLGEGWVDQKIQKQFTAQYLTCYILWSTETLLKDACKFDRLQNFGPNIKIRAVFYILHDLISVFVLTALSWLGWLIQLMSLMLMVGCLSGCWSVPDESHCCILVINILGFITNKHYSLGYVI